VNELERAIVGGPGLVDSVEPAEELRSRRVQIVIGVEVEALHQLERGFDVAVVEISPVPFALTTTMPPPTEASTLSCASSSCAFAICSCICCTCCSILFMSIFIRCPPLGRRRCSS
jgi:hypothetical protein